MKILRLTFKLLLASPVLSILPAVAEAQGVIRFIASYGSDANPCTRTAPCRTMQAGVTTTPEGSELQVIDSGEYGPNVTITKSITISATDVSATLTTPPDNSFFINAPGKTVVIRGLLMNGLGAGERGFLVDAVGALYIEHCELQRFSSNAILFQPGGKLSVKETVIRNSAGDGLNVLVNSGTAQIVIDRTQFLDNGAGVIFQGSGTIEATVTDSISAGAGGAYGFTAISGRVSISRTTAANNNTGFTASGGQMTLERCIARGNTQAGIEVTSGTMRVSNSVSTNNGTGLRQTGGALFSRSALNNGASPGTNTVDGNGTDTSGAITYHNGN